MKNNIESDKYILYAGTGAAKGTFYIERLRDHVSTNRVTGSEASAMYKVLRNCRKRGKDNFDEMIERHYDFEV